MAYPPRRSLTENLNAGLTDGTYKKGIRERGGVVEHTTCETRDDLADTWYGIHELPMKIDPFGREIRTPDVHTGGPVHYPGS